MPSAKLLMFVVELKQVLFHSLNRNIHCVRNDSLFDALGIYSIILQKINIVFVLSCIFNKFAIPVFAGDANFFA